jgi:hypothetical protein
MARQMLPGEKRIEWLGVRVEEAERKALEDRARRDGVPTSVAHRQAIRHYLELEDPADEYLPPVRRLK